MTLELVVQEFKDKVRRNFLALVVEEIVIENADQLKNCSDLLAIGKSYEKDAAAKLAEITAPIMAQEQAARAAWKPTISLIHMAWGRIDDAIIRYHSKIKAEADALLIMQMQEQAAKIAESKETGEVIEPETRIVEQVSQTVRGNMGSTTIKSTPEFFISDEDAVERSLCSPDMKKIKARYASGIKDIKGVMITYKAHTVSRFG
jgi:hypothetical protein